MSVLLTWGIGFQFWCFKSESTFACEFRSPDLSKSFTFLVTWSIWHRDSFDVKGRGGTCTQTYWNCTITELRPTAIAAVRNIWSGNRPHFFQIVEEQVRPSRWFSNQTLRLSIRTSPGGYFRRRLENIGAMVISNYVSFVTSRNKTFLCLEFLIRSHQIKPLASSKLLNWYGVYVWFTPWWSLAR